MDNPLAAISHLKEDDLVFPFLVNQICQIMHLWNAGRNLVPVFLLRKLPVYNPCNTLV